MDDKSIHSNNSYNSSNSDFNTNNNLSFSFSKCHTIINWIIQILLFLSLIFLYIAYNLIDSESLNSISLFMYIGMFIIYTANNIIFSETLKLLFSAKKRPLLEDALSPIINAVPEIYLSIKCYHIDESQNEGTKKNNNKRNSTKSDINNENKSENMENEGKRNNHKNSSGSVLKINSSMNEKLIQNNKSMNDSENKTNLHLSMLGEELNTKIFTFIEKKKLQYYSSRDVSGDLLIDLTDNKKILFVKLQMNYEIYFADTLTAYDFYIQKEKYFADNRWRDVHMDIKYEKQIKNIFDTGIFIINNNIPFYLHWIFYFIFLILNLVEFYKLFVKRYIKVMDYTIKKIFSTRRKLNSHKLNIYNPKVTFNNRTYNYSKNEYYKKNKHFQILKVTKEDKEKVQRMNSTIEHICSLFEINIFKLDASEVGQIIDEYYQSPGTSLCSSLNVKNFLSEEEDLNQIIGKDKDKLNDNKENQNNNENEIITNLSLIVENKE